MKIRLFGIAVCVGLLFCGWRIYAGFRQSRLDHQLILAIQTFNEETAVSLICSGANPNAHDESLGTKLKLKDMLLALFGRRKAPSNLATSALAMAFSRSEMKVVKALLKQGANIGNGRDNSGVPYMVLAVKVGDTETARMLLQRDPKEANAAGADGDSAVAIAATEGKWELVQLLLDSGADTSTYSQYTHCTLYRAIEGGAPRQIIDRLIVLTVKRMDKAELAACLDEAVGKGKLDIARVLFSMGGRIKYRQSAIPSMVSAATSGNIAKMRTLLSFGADVNADERMGPPICQAAEIGRLKSVEFLIEQGADIDRSAYYNGNALTNSVEQFPQITKLLLEHGANPNHAERRGTTALMIAAYAGNAQSAVLLLNFGARVNSTDERGCTALMAAAEKGKTDVVRLLLAHNANYCLVGQERGPGENPYTVTALSLAKQNHHNEVIRLLKQAGARK